MHVPNHCEWVPRLTATFRVAIDFNDGAEKLMCVFETTEGRTGGRFSVKSVVSTNEGVSWDEERSQVYFPTNADSSGTSFAPRSSFAEMQPGGLGWND